MQGTIFDIAEGTIHDGPGLRITVFMKGCPLRCTWCHSPEGQHLESEMLYFDGMAPRCCGRLWESRDLAAHLSARRALLDHGEITFSGGEPLMQGPFLLEVLEQVTGGDIMVDSCGFADSDIFLAIARKVNRFFFGLKLLNNADSLRWTGQPCSQVLKNLLLLDRETDTPYRLRIPLLAGVTGCEAYLKDLMELVGKLQRAERIDFLPSNREAGAKYRSCRREFSPGFDIRETYMIPDWFQPTIPFRLLAENEVE